uniref:Caspase-8 n=1 Tax=Mytilus californianus TaxID=6549 RepID=D6BU26_MYTCA|nr:caspase-8-like protein [Mytilus californianus]
MIEFESFQYHNNINQTDLTKGLITIDGELESDDIKSLKFLCQDHIAQKTLEKIEDGIQIFNELERLGKIDTSRGEVDYLLESLCRCHRIDLIRKMGFNQIQVKNRVESGRSNFSPFRLLLFEIAEEMETADLKTALFTLSSVIPRSKHDKIKSICDVFIQLERSGDLSPVNVEVLYKLLKMMDRGDLITKVRAYQGAQPTGGNTELGYGPVEEGQIPRTIEIAMEPEYQGEGHIRPAYTVEQPRPTPATEHSVQFTGNQIPLHLGQFQNSTASVIPSQQEIVDIRGTRSNKNGRLDDNVDSNMAKRLKVLDRERDRLVPSQQEDPVFLYSQQEQPSTGNYPSVIGIRNQPTAEPSPVNRTGISSEVPVNHLVPRNDVVTEEQSPGDSGLTAGTVSLSDRSSQDISSGEVQLSITESKLVGISEVIARREDWMRLASALMIDYDRISEINRANPTNLLRVHGFLRHWFIEQKNKFGTSPNADGLLNAFRQLGFTDAIEEFVRLSLEPESENEQGSENLDARSEGSVYQEENFNVSSGEARVSQGNEDTDFRAATPPINLSNSGAQVGPSLNPLINQSIRQPNRQDDVIVRQMEAVAIDDSAMPFYKMNARPRGLAIIMNNQHFHKIRNDPQSKEMPARTGTEKDAEKLDYIWRKLDFEVRSYNDVDSTRMTQIMVETAFEDHSKYDCLVVSILTHGVLGHVYGADGRIVRISQLTSCFSGRRCPSLAGKPKLFFIQACQGREKQEGHVIETDGKGSMPVSDSSEERQDLNVDRLRELIPDEADFLLGYATVPGYVSYRSRSQGSWYINKLSQNLDKYAYQHDLLSILIKVNEEVGRATANIDNGAYKQIPAPMFTLRKRIIFR